MESKTKITWQLESPFTKYIWPEISSEHLETIIGLLYSLLSPIGKYRRNHITPSKGKRSKKRNRKNQAPREIGENNLEPNVPSAPEISNYIVVGLNNILRSLESLANLSRAPCKKDQEYKNFREHQETADKDPALVKQKFSAIFILSSSQPAIIQDILPQLVATASLAHPKIPGTRLLQLPNSCRTQLCEALNIPCISVIGLLTDAPLSNGLVQLIRKHLPEIEIPWLRESKKASYLSVKLKSVATKRLERSKTMENHLKKCENYPQLSQSKDTKVSRDF